MDKKATEPTMEKKATEPLVEILDSQSVRITFGDDEPVKSLISPDFDVAFFHNNEEEIIRSIDENREAALAWERQLPEPPTSSVSTTATTTTPD